jgi:hypothetical protein
VIYQFNKHYTVEQARALLPSIRKWLAELTAGRNEVELCEKRMGDRDGRDDLGGETVNRWVRGLVVMRGILMEFYSREIQLKDFERGLVDFPSVIGGREVFLCWEQGEEDIEYWHDLDSGYAGREHL